MPSTRRVSWGKGVISVTDFIQDPRPEEAVSIDIEDHFHPVPYLLGLEFQVIDTKDLLIEAVQIHTQAVAPLLHTFILISEPEKRTAYQHHGDYQYCHRQSHQRIELESDFHL